MNSLKAKVCPCIDSDILGNIVNEKAKLPLQNAILSFGDKIPMFFSYFTIRPHVKRLIKE